jgi:ankyrin repeat protein
MKIQTSLFLRIIVAALMSSVAIPALCLDKQTVKASPSASSSKVGELFCKAMERKNYDMMDTLIAQGANVNAPCESLNKLLPLFLVIKEGGYAKYQDSRDIYAYLIEHGADVNVRVASGATPTIEAAALFTNSPRTSIHVLELLISNGARVTDVDRADHTPLDYLAGSGYSEYTYDIWKKSMNLLLDNGAKINRQDKAGETVLMRSARGCGVGAVELMLGSGANPDLANKQGERAYDYALEGASSSSRGMMASCNEVVRILSNPQSYMKERAASAGATSGQPAQAGTSAPGKPPANLIDALNLLGKVLR